MHGSEVTFCAPWKRERRRVLWSPTIMEDCMEKLKVSEDVVQTWLDFKEDTSQEELRNQPMERYFSTVSCRTSLVTSARRSGIG